MAGGRGTGCEGQEQDTFATKRRRCHPRRNDRALVPCAPPFGDFKGRDRAGSFEPGMKGGPLAKRQPWATQSASSLEQSAVTAAAVAAAGCQTFPKRR